MTRLSFPAYGIAVLAALILLSVADFACAGDLVHLTLKDGTSIAGEVLHEDDTVLELRDLPTGKAKQIDAKVISQRRMLESDRSRIDTFGLAVYLAWQIKGTVQPDFRGKILPVQYSLRGLALRLPLASRAVTDSHSRVSRVFSARIPNTSRLWMAIS